MLRGCDGRSQENTRNLSRPGAWIEMNSSALSPTLMWPCPERIGVTTGCLSKVNRVWKQKARKKCLSYFSPIAMLPGIFQQINTKKKLQTLWPNYRPSIVIGLRLRFFFHSLRFATLTPRVSSIALYSRCPCRITAWMIEPLAITFLVI